MGLYLCIFNDEEEMEGVEVGSYGDYNFLRDYVVDELENGKPGSRFPMFILHSDCDGEWSAADCEKLYLEFGEIIQELKKRPIVPFISEWQKHVAKSAGIMPHNAFESFIDVDGEYLIDRLQNLAKAALEHQLPILFQ